MLDHELQARASLLHANQAAIERQERGVARALDGLRREDDRLMRLLGGGASREVKELGDVQNWAERVERDFLVLEETVRLVGEGGDGGSGGSWSGSGSGSGSWSGSERVSSERGSSERGSVAGDEDGGGDVRMRDVDAEDGDIIDGGGGASGETAKNNKGKGRQVDITSSSAAMDVDPTQVPLPLDDQDIVEGSHTTPPPGHSTAAAQPSTGAAAWLRRMVWRK